MSESLRTLAHYRLVEKVGEGGMGVVWRAEDTKLGRHVAIKLLPEAFSADPERLARFEREAKLLASLNHPNIAAIYGLEEAEGVRFLVLELVEGEDLAERLVRGPLPVAEALPIAAQIAEALQTAHASGVLHRDLKPANVKLGADGRAKVLDFGLAKAFLPDTSSPGLSLSPTMTAAATQGGVLLGTAAYMSPEQARGKPVDKRTDIWAFGCLLFELLTGRQAFRGETVTDILAAILDREPDWSALPGGMPRAARRVLERCLQKDADRRFHDIADVRIFLEDAMGGEVAGRTGGITGGIVAGGAALPGAGTGSGRVPGVVHAGWAAAALTLGLLAYVGGSQGTSRSGDEAFPAAAFAVTLPAAAERADAFSPPALSPDGTRLAFVVEEEGDTYIYLRRMDRIESQRLPGTEGADSPFFSPDGSRLAFFSGDMVQVLSLEGGTPHAVATALNHRGGTWGEDGWIYFTPNISTGIQRVTEAGGFAARRPGPPGHGGHIAHHLLR